MTRTTGPSGGAAATSRFVTVGPSAVWLAEPGSGIARRTESDGGAGILGKAKSRDESKEASADGWFAATLEGISSTTACRSAPGCGSLAVFNTGVTTRSSGIASGTGTAAGAAGPGAGCDDPSCFFASAPFGSGSGSIRSPSSRRNRDRRTLDDEPAAAALAGSPSDAAALRPAPAEGRAANAFTPPPLADKRPVGRDSRFQPGSTAVRAGKMPLEGAAANPWRIRHAALPRFSAALRTV